MKKSKHIVKRQTSPKNTRRLHMLKRTHKKVVQRRKEYVRAELVEQWSLAV